jgi:hypothetical protein
MSVMMIVVASSGISLTAEESKEVLGLKEKVK